MGCLSMALRPTQQPALAVAPLPQAQMSVAGVVSAAVDVNPVRQAELDVTSFVSVSVRINASAQAVLTIGEVCSVSDGEIYVLAATDGPLRTCDGGYLMLDPAGESN